MHYFIYRHNGLEINMSHLSENDFHLIVSIALLALLISKVRKKIILVLHKNTILDFLIQSCVLHAISLWLFVNFTNNFSVNVVWK